MLLDAVPCIRFVDYIVKYTCTLLLKLHTRRWVWMCYSAWFDKQQKSWLTASLHKILCKHLVYPDSQTVLTAPPCKSLQQHSTSQWSLAYCNNSSFSSRFTVKTTGEEVSYQSSPDFSPSMWKPIHHTDISVMQTSALHTVRWIDIQLDSFYHSQCLRSAHASNNKLSFRVLWGSGVRLIYSWL